MSSKRNVIHGVKWTSLSAIVNMFAKLGQIAILTRYLSKEDFGLVAVALLFISFTEIFMDMGFSSAVLHKQNISKNEYSSLYWFNIITGIIICIILYASAPFIATYYKQQELTPIISLLSINIIFSSISKLQRTFQQKQMQFKIIALIEMSASILMLIISTILAINNFGIYSLIYSTLFYGFIIALFYLTYSIIWEKNIRFHFRISEIVFFLKIGIYQVGSSILDYLSREMDLFFISSNYSFEILGVYSICKQLSLKIFNFINPIITKISTPFLANIQNNKFELHNKYIYIIRILALINIPIYFCLAYSSPYALGIVYGNSYIQYSLLFSILCINYAFSSIGNPVGSLLIALGKTNIGFYWTIYRIISTSIFLYIGSLGGINLFVLSILIVNLINIYPETKIIYEKLIGVGYKEYTKSFSKPLFYALLLSPLALFQFWIKNAYTGLFIIGILFTTLYIVLNFTYNKKELNNLNSRFKLDHFKLLRSLFLKYQIYQ